MGPSANVMFDNYMTVLAESRGILDPPNGNGKPDPRRSKPVIIGKGHRGDLPEEPDLADLAMMSYDRMWGREGMSNGVMTRSSFGLPRKPGKDKATPHKSFFTSVEQKLYKAILSQRLPYDFWAQYMINGDPRLRVDGAFPQIKIAVEADGREWHADQESIAKDKRRDAHLASQGWMVLRFTEEEIAKRMNEVVSVISKAINSKVQAMGTKVAADILSGRKVDGDRS